MPIKLISSDAKGFLKKSARELGDFLYKNGRKNIPVGMLIPESFKKANQHIYNVKASAENLLNNQALWNETEQSPKLISDANTGLNGDWNGNKFFKAKIRGKLVLFKNALFDVTGLFTSEEAKLFVLKKHEAERSEIDFLKSRSSESTAKSESGREHIPERIRNEVWRRDGGKCVECGSVYNLEFDHVIPIAKGGSNTARNLRILCEPCNRRKSDSIG